MTSTEESLTTLDGSFPFPREPLDPPAVYRYMRAERPVVRVTLWNGKPAWLISRYDDVRAILTDPRVSADQTQPGFPNMLADIPDDQVSFLRMDPPRHLVFRKLLNKNFIIRKIDAMRPDLQRLVDDHIDAMLGAQDRRADLVASLALPVPSTVISWILGVSTEDREYFNNKTEETLQGLNPADPDAFARSLRGLTELRDYIEKIVRHKAEQEDPGDDILGQLVSAARAGEISIGDAINSGHLLIIAGHDTTASMTALGTLTLLQHPDQTDELRRDPSLIPAAVEELLRYLTVVHLIVARVAAEDIEIGGQVIPAGEAIFPLNLSANRDDAHFPDADSFDIHRNARDHFAFGYGIHQCLGQALARVELQIIFETLIRRVPTLKLAVPVDQVPFKLFSPINGVFELPVRW
jgi:cytochrome P450